MCGERLQPAQTCAAVSAVHDIYLGVYLCIGIYEHVIPPTQRKSGVRTCFDETGDEDFISKSQKIILFRDRGLFINWY